MIMENIALWGDSIARGVCYDELRNRYTVIRDTFERALKACGITVENHAKPGYTSEKGLALMKTSLPNAKGLAVIEFGGNDSDLNWDEVAQNPDIPHEAAVSIPDFERNLSEMIGMAKDAGMRPLIVTPLPVAAEKYLNWISRGRDGQAILRYLGSAEHIYRWSERYVYAAYRAAAKAACPVWDLRSLFLVRRDFTDLMCLDGIHPNAEGQALIRDAALSALNV